MAVEQVTYNSPDGATMGASITEKISFYGVSTVVQYPSVAAASTYVVSTFTAGGVSGLSSSAAVVDMVAQLSTVVAALKACGLVA